MKKMILFQKNLTFGMVKTVLKNLAYVAKENLMSINFA